MSITIHSKTSNYQVSFGNLKRFLSDIEAAYPQNCYVIDEKVWKLYYSEFFKNIDKAKVILLRVDENEKNLEAVQRLCDILIKRSVKRNLVLVSIGGGITQDITGFLASTLYRGVKWIFVPTTLLAQSDSCIGSKTSLNYRNFKNLLGTFYPPFKVLIDVNFTNTQNSGDFYSGLGEIVKLHLIGGQKYSDYILRKLPVIINRQKSELLKAIHNSLRIKQRYIEIDEFDKGIRNILNYGHCFGHALETASGFSVSHGQAVVLGMACANLVAEKRGLLAKSMAKKLFDYGLAPIIPNQQKRYFTIVDKIIAAMKKDKKRTGDKLPLIILKDKFKFIKLNDLTEDEVKATIKKLDCLLSDGFNNKEKVFTVNSKKN